MLNNLKAISLGLIVIFILGLLFQLVLILASVGYNAMAHSFPSLSQGSQFFNYTISTICYFIVMVSSGYITTVSSKKNHYANTIIAALLGMSMSLYLSLQQEIFTFLALFFLFTGLTFALVGCYQGLKSTAP